MTNTIKKELQTCIICALNNKKRPITDISHIPFARQPLEWISIDTIGGLNNYNSQKRYAHIAIDHLTRYIWVEHSKTQKAEDFITLIHKVNNDSIHKHKIVNILSDKYPAINSKKFLSFLSDQSINILFTCPDYPPSNGLIERANQTIIIRLKKKLTEIPNQDWTNLIEKCIEEYNKTIHTTIQYSPIDLLEKNDPLQLNAARTRTIETHEKEARRLKSGQQHNFSLQDKVLLENKNHIRRGKLGQARTGQITIKDKISSTFYLISNDRDPNEEKIVHRALLTPIET